MLLLDTRFREVSKQFPIAALQALSGSAKCRKQMVTAGACYHLRQLADMGVTGAKKLLDRLVTGKFRSIISKTLMVRIQSPLCPALMFLWSLKTCFYGVLNSCIGANLLVFGSCR